MNGRLNTPWKKCQRWLSGSLLALAVAAHPTIAQETRIPSFLSPPVYTPPTTTTGTVTLGGPQTPRPAETLPPIQAPAASTGTVQTGGAPPRQAPAELQQAIFQLQGQGAVVNAHAESKGKENNIQQVQNVQPASAPKQGAPAAPVPAPEAPNPAAQPPAVRGIFGGFGKNGVVNAVGDGSGRDSNGTDSNVKKAGCCGQGGLWGLATGSGCGPGGCGAANKCVPGRLNCCSWCNHDTHMGRLFCGFYECLCCPDPCYEPHWVPTANAAFFTDPVRPVTMTRIRWDAGRGYLLPDRSEYFWARADGKGRGPANPEAKLRYDDLMLYQEVAAKGASIFFEIPYRSVDPVVNNHASGFSDMNVGVKSLLFDCELLQLAFQFRTYLPVGNAGKGLGTGHVSLEPSLLASLKLAPDTYLQTQVAEWIPLGGDPDYAGAVLHYHASINHVLYRCLPDVPLIGTCEFNGWSFQDGQFTDPVFGSNQKAGNNAYLNAGPGLRLVICNKIDFGVGAMFGLNQPGLQQWYRSELRIRF